ncbi:hypothetical protein WEI85_23695 [Actinomycetes bacterium KLBMP 9797]
MSEEPVNVKPSVGGWLSRLWRWLLAALRGPEPAPVPVPVVPPPPPPPGWLRERRHLQPPLVVPASGYIFTFQVHASFVWTSYGITRDMLSSSVQHFMPYLVRELKATAARRAREHEPHQAHRLETELQDWLEDKGVWRYTRDGVEVTCRPHVWVELEDRVKQAVQPYWEELIKLDCEHTVRMKRVEYAKDLSDGWLAVLTDLVGSPVAEGAAQMTEKEFADVVQKIMAERKAAAEKLNTLLEEKIRHGDAFDRMEHFDMLKERLERQAAFNGAAQGNESRP